jgi:hypothetical protein
LDSSAASLVSALADFDSLRRRLESSVVAGATAVDGRTLTYQAPIGTQVVSPGGFVSLVDGDRRALGQVLDQVLAERQSPATTSNEVGLGGADRLELTSQARPRVIEGTGCIPRSDGLPFVDAAIESSPADEVEAFSTEANSTRPGSRWVTSRSSTTR